ncbi:50S ribosomal protein L24 [Paramuribaculum intestinale]|jgi:large subunit ribosomal protein L24|uniref:Large ribosomal subunit protein uL24 n=1 Tax=Paramuribaculum intestinale TaxID=2094151 RepID=A0A2V1IXY4_9BACT|nr:50S ribosomal protein L24 [Paramuribaculum intestinale]MCX4330374.1 50S ribosomal protein L24 [Paramuribaculum intestinale]PWB07163.1 50S ribosomal protein L24 [Paramuribaculum intestinale]PWB12791.1 50S ribosomal protein L24 [Paramuribaculum intestinale]WLT41809.1 50S ribosomal protein L24 [Paramuribaculum intestinale]
MNKINIKKGDTVYVLAGDDRGKTGRVLKVDAAKQRAIVEGVNVVTKATKPSAKHPQGGLVKMEAPVHVSNLSLIDPKSGKPTRVFRKKNDEGRSVRYAQKSGEEIK